MNARKALPFSRIGGHPALDLVNTTPMGPDGPRERLTDFQQLVRWMEFVSIARPVDARRLFARGASKEAAAALDAVRALRGDLRATLEAGGGERRWRSLAVAINDFLERHPGELKLIEGDKGGFDLRYLRRLERPLDLVGVVAGEIASFIASGDLERTRRCEGSGCVLWFVDRTRNGSRHWCRMETCGARAKAKTYYRKRRGKG
jgi:predicted RNA-binding Zn ribbon-like protein